ncbi:MULTISPECIES: hypothetical protein [Salinicola]|uniref:Uncharacterized protein n=1 Tax=Salinicola socius TaxID=404433 RepID=A0A1Q8SUN7_9GAMM|nr:MULTISPECIES: hypothetical protein [Salinicola]OLO05126.1 hypothetical protein BTW07_05805 [Salinicola socius]
MIRVTLDLTCSICDHDQFFLPVRAEEIQQIRCANCTAFKCYSADLENTMIALNRDRNSRDSSSRDSNSRDERHPSRKERLRQDRANAA